MSGVYLSHPNFLAQETDFNYILHNNFDEPKSDSDDYIELGGKSPSYQKIEKKANKGISICTTLISIFCILIFIGVLIWSYMYQ